MPFLPNILRLWRHNQTPGILLTTKSPSLNDLGRIAKKKFLHESISSVQNMFHSKSGDTNLELDHLSLSLLVTTQLKMLASFQWNLFSELAFTALHSQHNLLCSLCFLVMNGSSLTTKTWLFPFVTSLSFGKSSLLCSFVLCHLVKGVFTAFGSFAKRFSCFWNVHHFDSGQWLLSLKKMKNWISLQGVIMRFFCRMSYDMVQDPV